MMAALSDSGSARSLRAIMFTDVVGYSALMREDESQALAVLARQRALLPPLIASHGGTLHKEIGDGLLASFPSAVEALQCARTLQRVLVGERFRIRIGLHLGDVIAQGGDVLGDGVNLASRIEPLAAPGGIVLSSDFVNAVRSQPGFQARSLGLQTLKNLGAPVEVFALADDALPASTSVPVASPTSSRARLAWAGLAIVVAITAIALGSRWLNTSDAPVTAAQGTPTASPAANAMPSSAAPAQRAGAAIPARGDDRAIAVLPFVNMSGDAQQEFFSDGITEELLNHLAQVSELRVTARTSSFAFKGKQLPISEIAASLGVGHVLEGSVRRAGNTVRITAQLIRASDSSHLWSATYDRPLDDIFRVQDEISAAVVKELKARLLHVGPDRGSVDPEAYTLYLQASQQWTLGSASAAARAVELLRQATERDPRFVDAWSLLARTLWAVAGQDVLLNGGSGGDEQRRLVAEAKEAAARALAIDPGHALTVARLAMIERRESGMEAYVARIQQALALNPTDPAVLFHATEALAMLGRIDEALVFDEVVARRDPMNPIVHGGHAMDLETADRLPEAEAAIRRALALNPEGAYQHAGLAFILTRAGRLDEAATALSSESVENRRLWMSAILEHARGNAAASNAALAKLIDEYRDTMGFQIAEVYGCRNEPDEAFRWLEDAERRADFGLEIAHLSTCLRSLHDDPRWLPFLKRIGRDPERLARIPLTVKLPDEVVSGGR